MATLTPRFIAGSTAQLPNHNGMGDVGVHYLWLNDKPVQNKGDTPAPMPLPYIATLINLARANPLVAFHLWLDDRFMGENYAHSLKQAIDKHVPGKNVTLGDLKLIGPYAHNPIFAPEKQHNLFARVDLARLLILDYALATGNRPFVIYSDLDITNPNLSKALGIMRESGLVLAGSRENDRIDTHPENGYLGIGRDSPSAMAFLKTLIEKTIPETGKGYNGYFPFITSVGDYFGEDFNRLISRHIATFQPISQHALPGRTP